MASVREMLEKQKLLAQQKGRIQNLNPNRKVVVKPTVHPLAEHLLSKERRQHPKQFFRPLLCAVISNQILPQTNEDGYFAYDRSPFEINFPPEQEHYKNYYCTVEEVDNVFKYVLDNLDQLSKSLQIKTKHPSLPEDHLDCILEINFQSDNDKCSIQCTLIYDNLPTNLISQFQIKGLQSFQLGTWLFKNGQVQFAYN